MPGRTHFTDAILLRAIDYGDADRILTFLTADFGKISALIRGARGSRRRFAGALEPYCLVQVEVGFGRGELARIAQASVRQVFRSILRDLHRITLAGAALELVRESVPFRQADPRVFGESVSVLEALDTAQDPGEELLLAFTVRLLSVLGLAPELEVCTGCGRRALEGQAALFDPRRGTVVCRACGGGPVHLSGTTRERLLQARASDWTASTSWSDVERKEARAALDPFVAGQIGRPLAGGAMVSQIERKSP